MSNPALISFPYCDYKSGQIRTIAVNIAAIESIEFDVPISGRDGRSTRVAIVRMRRNILDVAEDGTQRSRNVYYIVAGQAAEKLREVVRKISADCEPKPVEVSLPTTQTQQAPQPQQPRQVTLPQTLPADDQVDPLLKASYELVKQSAQIARRK